MKSSILIFSITFFSLFAKGQHNIFKNKPWEDFKRKELLSQKLKLSKPAIDNYYSKQLPAAYDKSVLMTPITGTFIENTGKGTDLYVVDFYKMPCVVPDETFISNMPVTGYDKFQKNPLLLTNKENEKK